MIPVLDAKGAPHIRLPLWSDPVIQQANWPTPKGESSPSDEHVVARAVFMAAGDADTIEVPERATIVTIRALSAAEMGVAARSSGRKPQLGAVVAQRKSKFRESIGDVTKDESATAAFATWLDALDDREAQALEAWDEYEAKRFAAIAKAGVVSIEQPGHKWESLEGLTDIITSPTLRDNITHELGYRVQAYSGLGIRPKGLSNSACGSERPTDSESTTTGDATDVLSSSDGIEVVAAALSHRA